MKNVVITVLAIIAVAESAIILMNKGGMGSSGGIVVSRDFKGETLAKVDGVEIKDTEIKERLDFITQGRSSSVDLKAIDNKGIEALSKEAAVQRKILEKAYEKGIQKDDELQDKIKAFIENVYKEKFLETIAKANVTDEKIKKLYDDLVNKAKNSSQYKVRHILLRDEKTANLVREELKTMSFADAAKKYSLDKPSGVNGGDLGYIFPEEYVVEFADAVRKATPNQVTAPVKTEFGYHLIKVEDSRKAEIIPFEKAKDRLEKQLGSEGVKAFIEELSKDMKVDVVRPEPAKPSLSADAPAADAKKAAPAAAKAPAKAEEKK